MLPKTSQPSPAAFAERFEELAPRGEIICLTISSKPSGTHQSACLAAEMVDAHVTAFDTLTASVAHGLQDHRYASRCTPIPINPGPVCTTSAGVSCSSIA